MATVNSSDILGSVRLRELKLDFRSDLVGFGRFLSVSIGFGESQFSIGTNACFD